MGRRVASGPEIEQPDAHRELESVKIQAVYAIEHIVSRFDKVPALKQEPSTQVAADPYPRGWRVFSCGGNFLTPFGGSYPHSLEAFRWLSHTVVTTHLAKVRDLSRRHFPNGKVFSSQTTDLYMAGRAELPG